MRGILKLGRLMGLVLVLFVGFSGTALFAETIEKTFEHQLLVNTPPQAWEHRIDLPDSFAQKGQVFTKRNLSLLGRLVIEREEFTPTYYYVKVKLPKHFEEFAKGFLTVTLDVGAQPAQPQVIQAPSDLIIHKISAARKPIFTWKGEGKYAAVSLFDMTTGKTVWERVIVSYKGAEYDEGYLDLNHHFKWAVKQSDESGRYTKESQAGFRIETQNGTVVIVTE